VGMARVKQGIYIKSLLNRYGL